VEACLREACACLENRLRAGHSSRAENFFSDHPSLAASAESALDLIYTEFLTRLELNRQQLVQEMCARFPALADDLRKQFQFHSLLQDGLAGAALDPAAARPPQGPAWAEHLAGYELLEEIGRGGIGIVYRARHRDSDQVVALKVLVGPAGPCEAERFRAEASALTRLRHPNIVGVYDVSSTPEQPYLAMEYVAGGNLAQALGGQPVPVAEAALLVETLARAVHYAHQQGVIHRDLKPGNILLQRKSQIASPSSQTVAGAAEDCGSTFESWDFEPKIADFGLARLLGSAVDGQAETGEVLGTPSYMAPEQVGGAQTAGPAADVYALGAILYELLTGRPPFKGETLLETLDQLSSQEPVRPALLRPWLPRVLEAICLRCLRKDPQQRPASAAELADELDQFLAGAADPAAAPGRSLDAGSATATATWRYDARQRRGSGAGLRSLSCGHSQMTS
jgi:serine/threonine protein kinase